MIANGTAPHGVTMELTVTSFHPSPANGGIMIGSTGDGASRRVRIGANVATREPKAGEDWRVTGAWVDDPDHGRQVRADIALPLVPRGEAIVRWIATNQAVAGVGRITAGKLWKVHGTDLYRILQDGDAGALAADLGPVVSVALTNEFRMLADEVHVLEQFDRYGFDAATAMMAAQLWGRSAVQRLEDDPYALSALQPWRKVDDRARRLGIATDDPRRLRAAVEEVVARRYRGHERGAGGHTASERRDILAGLRSLLGRAGERHAAAAFDLAVADGQLVERAGMWQGRGPAMMEAEIERKISSRLREVNAPREKAESAIAVMEAELGFRMDRAQIAAVKQVAASRFCIVDGAAGTGKSTVTRAIMHLAHDLDRAYTQIALSGRAAKRLQEATGHDAMTVHRFLKAITVGGRKMGAGILVIDEASMIATPDLWQIMSWIPDEVSVVLVGDPGQLPPIGAGNPLAALVGTTRVPRATLSQVHRQLGDSAIPVIASAIRTGAMPEVPRFDAEDAGRDGVFIAACSTADVPDTIMGILEAFVGSPADKPDRAAMRHLHAARVQILGMTLRGPAGVTTLSDRIERRWAGAQPPIHDWGIAETSKILWTRNSYDHDAGSVDDEGRRKTVDIMNGSLGIVQHATPKGAMVLFDDEAGTRTEIRPVDLQRILRGWAITVHKAQGSAFERVIIPIVPSRLLDRTMIYTAITRARRTAVLVGDVTLLEQAVSTFPAAASRRQCLLS
ncbi:AAA family ATPase [Sphingomonas mollis]|nr:AAA family ATPase [Sphingomonas sp. BT553]